MLHHWVWLVALDLSAYAGKYIALDVRTFKVVAESDDPDKLFEELKKRGIDIKYISIDYVNKPDEIVLL